MPGYRQHTRHELRFVEQVPASLFHQPNKKRAMTEHIPKYAGRDNHTSAETSREPCEENSMEARTQHASRMSSIEELRKAGAAWRNKLLN